MFLSLVIDTYISWDTKTFILRVQCLHRYVYHIEFLFVSYNCIGKMNAKQYKVTYKKIQYFMTMHSIF